MKLEFVPDLRICRQCGATTNQKEFWPESYMHSGQSLRRCGHCAAIYLLPDLTPDSQLCFYTQHYRKLFLTEIIDSNLNRFFRHRFEFQYAEVRANRLLPLIPTPGRVFELGSGFGTLLGVLSKHRPDLVLYASEHDGVSRFTNCRESKVTWLSDYGAQTEDNYFDAIVAYHSLEHLQHPVEFLTWAARKLKSKGILLLEVPDAGGSWRTRKLAHPAHLSYFSSSSLRRLLISSGFEVSQCGPHPDGAPFAGTLLAVASPLKGSGISSNMATCAEIDELDRKLSSVNWGLSDQLQCMVKRILVRTFGAEYVGALSRWRSYRKEKKAWNAF